MDEALWKRKDANSVLKDRLIWKEEGVGGTQWATMQQKQIYRGRKGHGKIWKAVPLGSKRGTAGDESN